MTCSECEGTGEREYRGSADSSGRMRVRAGFRAVGGGCVAGPCDECGGTGQVEEASE